MLTGRAARSTTWRILDEWIAEHSSTEAEVPKPRAVRTRAAAKKAPAKKTPAKKPAKKVTARADAIGSNPERRYGSGSSRGLAAKK